MAPKAGFPRALGLLRQVWPRDPAAPWDVRTKADGKEEGCAEAGAPGDSPDRKPLTQWGL